MDGAAAPGRHLPADPGCQERPARQLRADGRTGDGPRRRHDLRRRRHGQPTRLYDNNLNGVFGEAGEIQLLPATSTAVAAQQIAPDLHQPYIDEFIVGFRRQFGWQMGLDIGYINRAYKDTWAEVDINGFYPDGPGLPFGGFGKVDPNQGIVRQQTNNTWSQLKYQAIELTVTKNMSHGFQFIGSFNRQWHKIDGTWNPTDPARFVQPDHFANNANLYMPRGNNEENSLPDTGNELSYGPTWMKYRGSVGGVWLAPWDIRVAGNLTVQAGPWSGSPLYQLAANDPDVLRYGPATVTLANGTHAAEPPGDAQPLCLQQSRRRPGSGADDQHPGPENRQGPRYRRYEVEVAGNIFNLLNAGNYTQYSYNSAYQSWSSNFLLMVNQQPARAFQLTVVGRFWPLGFSGCEAAGFPRRYGTDISPAASPSRPGPRTPRRRGS